MLGVRDRKVRAVRRGPLGGFDLVGETVGFTKLNAGSVPALRAIVDATHPDADYEVALDAFVAEHGAGYMLVRKRPWIEIDFPSDVKKARQVVLPLLERSND